MLPAPDSDEVLVALDFSNAFNTLSRRAILERLYANNDLSALFGIADYTLGMSSPLLVFSHEGIAYRLASAEGVRQGSVLGPFLFALGLDPLLREFQSELVVAYLDDVTLRVRVSDASNAIQRFASLAGAIGLRLNGAKTQVFGGAHLAAREFPPLPPGVTFDPSMINILGVPFSYDGDLVRDAVIQKARSHEVFFERVERLHPLLAVTMLSLSGVPRLTYLTRVIPFTYSCAGAEAFDQLVFASLGRILHESRPLLPSASAIYTLPLRLGGLGVRPLRRGLEFAFDASRTRNQELMSETVEKIETEMAANILDNCKTLAAKAMCLAARAPQASAWLIPQPWKTPDVLDELPQAAPAREMLRLRVGLEREMGPAVCSCRASLAENGPIHALTCFGFSKSPTHNRIALALLSALQEARLSPAYEPVVSTANERPDLTVMVNGNQYILDVSVAFPGAQSYLPHAAANYLGAAGIAERRKCVENVRLVRDHPHKKFVPFIMETYGGMGPQARDFIDLVAKECFTGSLASQRVAWKDRTIARLGLALASGTGTLLSAMTAEIRHGPAATRVGPAPSQLFSLAPTAVHVGGTVDPSASDAEDSIDAVSSYASTSSFTPPLQPSMVAAAV
jgi:hypothetical protein